MKNLKITVLIFITTFLFWGCVNGKDETTSISEQDTIKKVDLSDIIHQTGTVVPTIKIELKSEAIGKIEKIFVKEGQKVRKGDTILVIDPDRLNTQKEKLELFIEKAKINYAIALRDYANVKALEKTGSVSAKKVQDLILSRDLQEIEVKQQRLELKDILDQLAKTVITSPLNGVITALLVKEGEIAVSAISGFQSGTSIGTIADISQLEVITNIGEVDYIHLDIGQKVSIIPEALEQTETHGVINFISLSAKKEANSELSRFEIRASIDSVIPGIAPGINVNVGFVILERKQVLGIPYQYVKKSGKDSFVSIVTKDVKGKTSITQKKIYTGVTDYKYYEVLSGLSAGDIVYNKAETDVNFSSQ